MKKLAISIFFVGAVVMLAGELADFHDKQVKSGSTRSEKVPYNPTPNTNHGITEIGIERTGCFGRCASYTFIAKSDGTFRYKGEKYVERIGEFKGKIPYWHFQRLAQFIRESGYMDLKDSYEVLITCQQTVYTTVVMKGKRKVISDYSDAGPAKLWAIEELIDNLITQAEWEK